MQLDRQRNLICALLACAVFLTAGAARAETQIVIVLDASGTMAAPGAPGTGNTKFDEVKSALTAMLQELPADIAVGLRLMGGTPAADCYSSYLYLQPTTGMRSQLQDILDTIQPAGSRALYQGIDDALTDLSGRSPQTDRVILVITDAGDDCDRDFDPLIRIYEHQPNAPRVVVYGLDFSDIDRQTIGTFVAVMGGRLVDLSSTSELRDALVAFAREFTNNLRIHVQDSSGTSVKADLTIRNVSTGALVAEVLDVADYSTTVPPGTYQVVGRYLGQEVRSEQFTLGPNESRTIALVFEIYLEPFTVTLHDLCGHALRARVTFLNSLGDPVITTELDSVHRVELPPDTYEIEIRIGDRVERIVGVLVGPGYESVREIEVPIELGILEVEVSNLDGLPVNARIRIFDSDGTLVDEAPFASYLYSQLPPGSYRTVAEFAAVKAEESAYLFEGEQRQLALEIDVPVGDMFVMLRTESGNDVWGWVRVYDSGGNLLERWDPERMEAPDWFITNVPVGVYRIEAEAENIVRVVTGVEVKADEETEVTITFPEEVF
jgi:hypothetical protein